jgi:serine phosphatase RsbU (regulator of sigma subunit)
MKSGDRRENGGRRLIQEPGSRQQRELDESLKYASYIQQAMLPDPSEIGRYLPEHLLFYMPCNIVSGDFYFITCQVDNIYLAVGDCTGHGVPGAFMSILGLSFLHVVISRFNPDNASQVLNQMREHVMKALSQTGAQAEQKDGIDMALCIINRKSNVMQFAGAFNPIYVIRNRTLIEYQGDKMPVGIGSEQERPFKNHQIELQNGDMIYLFSDGFADQFGGRDGKKFKYRPFRELLIDISELPANEQKIHLQQTFNDWKGNLKQLDDVLVFGFRYTMGL